MPDLVRFESSREVLAVKNGGVAHVESGGVVDLDSGALIKVAGAAFGPTTVRFVSLVGVIITNPQDGDILKYSTSLGAWINAAP